MRELWNAVCCHGNKTGIILLWSTCSIVLLQRIRHFGYKLAEISFFIIADQNSVVLYEVITWLICIFQKLEYLWNKTRYLKKVNRILCHVQTTSLCFKMAQIGKMQISSQQHFKESYSCLKQPIAIQSCRGVWKTQTSKTQTSDPEGVSKTQTLKIQGIQTARAKECCKPSCSLFVDT